MKITKCLTAIRQEFSLKVTPKRSGKKLQVLGFLMSSTAKKKIKKPTPKSNSLQVDCKELQ